MPTKHTVLGNLLFISLLLLIVSSVDAQNHIVVENKIWSNVLEDCLPEGNVYTTYYHRFEGDTLVNGKSFKKVMIAEDELHQEWFFGGQFIREENNRVYLLDSFGEEGLIYDFNLVQGDTVTINNPLAPDGLLLTLTGIDSVETFDGYRKRWKLEWNEFSTPEYWIEGVGSQSGVLNSGTGVFGPLCGAYTLLCEKEDGVTIYQNPDYQTCYYVLLDVGEENEKANDFKIRYSNGGERINLLFGNDKIKNIQITSLTGNIILKTQSYDQELSIDQSIFARGLHVISVVQNNAVISKKIMVY